jgi:uncharacterized surface protein with fasciclin (FAS1) repeats
MHAKKIVFHGSMYTALLLASLAGCASSGNGSNPSESTGAAPTQNLVATAEGAGFNTLVTAVKAAGLEDTLKGPGPFTVFAPTDAAFAKVPEAKLKALLEPQNKAMLQAVLTYHVVAGKVMAADVVKLTSAKTVEGADASIKVMDGKVMVNDANVTTTDVAASNGVIHVIDTVLLPPS